MLVRSVRVAVTLYSPTRPFGVHARSVSALDFRLECRNMQRLRDEGNQVSHPRKPAPDASARKNERGPGTAPSPCSSLRPHSFYAIVRFS
jgi:hypothetical protein